VSWKATLQPTLATTKAEYMEYLLEGHYFTFLENIIFAVVKLL